jgi:hypothetical protein
MASKKAYIMKNKTYITKLGLITYWALLPWCLSAQAQDPYKGIWEGNFMEQFKTVILLDQAENAEYIGKILMYSGENRIQDDELTKISIENSEISFYIAAKETSFKGFFNESNTELSGNFIFPDESKHPLAVRKYEKDSLAAEGNASSFKDKIRENFPVEELKSDLREMIRKLKEYHPRLHAYTTEASFDEEVEEIMESLDSPMSLEAYYYQIAPLVADVKCSHTGIRLPEACQREIHDHGLYFPLRLYVQDGSAYFISAPGQAGVEMEPGCEILAINDRPVKMIIQELLKRIPSEGHNLSHKYQELNRKFQDYFHMMDPSADFSIAYASSGAKGNINLKALSYSMVGQAGSPALAGAPYSFQIPGNSGNALLKISSFGLRDMDSYFAFLDSAFRLMHEKQVQHLILDLRDNMGGHPIFAAQLLSYLSDKEFTYFRRNPDVADFEPLYLPMQPNAQHFTGNVIVLVNGNCLSTTGHLISLLKYHTDALFMGEDPGSTYLCNDFSTQIKLQHTGLELNIPRTTFVTAVSGFSDQETFPLDYAIKPSIQDILDGRDAYGSYAYELMP